MRWPCRGARACSGGGLRLPFPFLRVRLPPVTRTALKIYAPPQRPIRLTAGGRLVGAMVAAACLALMGVSLWLQPDSAGAGTHRQLGLIGCQTLSATGVPCPSCGMTTSFAWFVRGNLAASFYNQPAGCLLALGVCMTFWAALYIALTGRPVYRLATVMRPRWVILSGAAVVLAAWGWKIYVHAKGLDGW